MEWVTLVAVCLALGALINIKARRWRRMFTAERLEAWGIAILLASLTYGLIEVHTTLRLRFPIIAVAVLYLLVAYLLAEVQRRRHQRH